MNSYPAYHLEAPDAILCIGVATLWLGILAAVALDAWRERRR